MFQTPKMWLISAQLFIAQQKMTGMLIKLLMDYDTSDSECASTMSETIPWWILELDQTYSVSKIAIQTSGKWGFLKGQPWKYLGL